MSPQPQPNQRPLIISEPDEVSAALFEIDGLTREVVLAAVEEGERGRQNCTVNHPVTAPGTMFYFDTVRALRDQLSPDWKKKCDGGSELTISPSGKHALVVASGDENVGSLTHAPRTKRRKGNRTRRAARANVLALQGDFFEITDADLKAIIEEKRRNATMITHILLAHRTDEKLIVELSVVFGLDGESHASEWAQRIIVGELPLDELPPRRMQPVDPTPDFDVPVTRRIA